MYEFNLLDHIEDSVETLDKSNIWKNDQILDIPVYTPNSVSLPIGIGVYGSLDPYTYMFYFEEKIYILYGLDIKGRYTFLQLGLDSTKFNYRFSGRSFPQARDEACIRFYNNKLYLSGGYLNGSMLNDHWCYDPLLEEWTLLPPLPSARCDHSILYLDDYIYLFGGRVSSKIDGRELYTNDAYRVDTALLGDWELLERDALLPHVRGSVLGADSSYLYILANKKIWQVGLNDDGATELSGEHDLAGQIFDVWDTGTSTYLLVKESVKSNTGTLYEWTSPDNFTPLRTDIIGWDTDNTDTVLTYDDGTLLVDSVELGGTPPPSDSNSMMCNAVDSYVMHSDRFFYFLDKATMHTETVDATHYHHKELKVDLVYYPAMDRLYTLSWPTAKLSLGYIDMETRIYTPVGDFNISKRSNPSIVIVQDTLWLVGGHSESEGYIQEQWRYPLTTSETEWTLEVLLAPLPTQPFALFEWRERLWMIPQRIDQLYRYYPSTLQWEPIYVNDSDGNTQSFGTMDNDLYWAIVEDLLILEPEGELPVGIDLEGQHTIDLQYKGELWIPLDRNHLITREGRLYVFDGTTMTPLIADSPPYFENSGHRGGSTGLDLIPSYSYIYWGYNMIGEYLPIYADMVGLFWVDNIDVRWGDLDQQVGFYTPQTDYAGDPTDQKRRLPTMQYTNRNNFPLFKAMGDTEFDGSRFVFNPGRISRYRVQDGSTFSYNAPISNGCAIGCSSEGKVFVFGGQIDTKILNIQQNGVYYGNKIGASENSLGSTIICKPTFLLYDLNYAKGEIEYLAEQPDFYERHDYAIAAEYLISRLKQLLLWDDQVNNERAVELQENYYTRAQAIIDDVAVRYITAEEGPRPSSRSWSNYTQIDDKLYIGGGAFEVRPNSDKLCPPLTSYGVTNENYDDPNQEYDNYTSEIGRVKNNTLDDFYVFDMQTNSWTQLANAPWDHLFHASMVATKDKKEIWVVGGYTSSSMATTSREIYIYTVSSNSWTSFNNVPTAYMGRAKPAIEWLDDDTLLIMYGSVCEMSSCGDCPCYTFNSMGDSWILNREAQLMYKYDSDLPKTFTIMPSDQDEPYVDLLYIPDPDLPVGGHRNIVENLTMSRALSEDWTPYGLKYNDVLKGIYDQLYYYYDEVTYSNSDGSQEMLDLPAFDGYKSVISIYNQVLPNFNPNGTYNYYIREVFEPERGVSIPGNTILLWYILVEGQDFTKALLYELSSRSPKSLIDIPVYDVDERTLFLALDNITNSPYPANRISPTDLLLIKKSLLTGESVEVKRIVKPYATIFDIKDIKDIFRYKDGSWWLIGYFRSITGQSNIRSYRFSDRPDGDIDLTELAADIPTEAEPLAVGYDGKDLLICIFDEQNIWSMNIDKAIVDPNSSYWRRLPPALGYKNKFHNEMRHMMKDHYILFFDGNGMMLSYDTENNVWSTIREATSTAKDTYVAVDNTELYYLGSTETAGYFDTRTFQGDRFIINTDICELGIGTPVLPRLTVQRNLVMGFDVNNNLVGAFTRKRGKFDKSWALSHYFHVDKILISVDYDSLVNTDHIEVYVKTPEGVSRFPVYAQEAQEAWSFNPYIRTYQNGTLETSIPDQYLAVDVQDEVAEFQVIYQPPVKDSGYVAHINAVLLVPKRNHILTVTDPNVACEDAISIGINNNDDEVKHILVNSDDEDLAISVNNIDFSSQVSRAIKPHTQLTLKMKALHRGKIAHLMVVQDKSKE